MFVNWGGSLAASEVCHGDGNFVHICFASSQALSAPGDSSLVDMHCGCSDLFGGSECLLGSKWTAPSWEADGLSLRCQAASAVFTMLAQLRWVVFLAPVLSSTQYRNG